ncbi:MAG: AAA family ATPase [Pseudomonadota bacterium]
MAEYADLAAVTSPLNGAVQVTGTIYVIDLIGFSQITEAEISASERSGTESVTRLVTALFRQMMSELTTHDIQFGGFAGDALIAWQTEGPDALSDTELENIAIEICAEISPGLAFRTASAQGQFWCTDVSSQNGDRPLLWGSALTAAFEVLDSRPRRVPESTARPVSHAPLTDENLATASVLDRWVIVLRTLSPAQCRTTEPDALATTLRRVHEIAEAYAAEIDNIVQDDKGLLIIVSATSAPAQSAIVDGLTGGRAPIAGFEQIAVMFGTVFRCHFSIADHNLRLAIGAPINRAAKSLLLEQPQTPAVSLGKKIGPIAQPETVFGRERETQQLVKACRDASTRRHTAVVIGPAGIGKSTVIETLAIQAPEPTIAVEVTPGSRYLPLGCAQDLAEACGLPAATAFHSDGKTLIGQRLPSVTIIENWQWCDEDSKRLIRTLHSDRDTGLLVITSREAVPDIEQDTVVRLKPLDYEQSDQLIESLAPGILDTARKRSIFDISAGTPFWLAQAALHDAEQKTAGRHRVGETGLEGLLDARSQDLTAPAMALWRLYCAWRSPLSFQLARELLAKFDIRVDAEHFQELERLGWVATERSSDQNEHRPSHDILADWGISDLPLSFERALHGRIAHALTLQHGPPSRIAAHWQTAGRPLRAAVWFNRAASHADRAGAHQLTLTHLSHSENVTSAVRYLNPVKVLEHLAFKATALWGIGKLRKAKHALQEFEAVAKRVPACDRKRAALLRAATMQSEVGQFAGNSALIMSGLYQGWRHRHHGEDGQEVKARRDGFIYYALGLLKLPVAGRLRKLVEIAHERGAHRSETLIGCSLATLHMTRCKWSEAQSVLTDCHSAIALTDDRQMLGVAQCLLGLSNLFQGRTDAALSWFERLAETGRDQDHQLFIVWGAYAKAEAKFYAGERITARTLACDARRQSKGLGDHQSACIIEGLLAQIYLADADFERAHQHARNAARFAAILPPTNFSTLEGIAAPAMVGAELAQIRGVDPELSHLIKVGRKALKSYAQVFKMAVPRQLYVEGLVARSENNIVAAKRYFKRAQTQAQKSGMQYERALAKRALNSLEESPHGATA